MGDESWGQLLHAAQGRLWAPPYVAEAALGALERPRSTNWWFGAMPSWAGLHEAEELAVGRHRSLGPTTGPKSPSSCPDRPFAACPLVSAEGRSLITLRSTAPLLGARFLEHSLVPRPSPQFFPGNPPPTSSSPVTWGSSSGPYLKPTSLGLGPCPSRSPHLPLPATRTHPGLGPPTAPTPDFSALHLPDDPRGPGPWGIRGTLALATASWTMHLLGHGGACLSHQWGLAQETPSLLQGGERSPFPSKWGFHPL